ncbi:hypothetical protein [Streptomyces sp. NPDC004546]|uniref:hypothetical protein n=1 Tax=Streptomyces sp. NPDC004546 TaxID=3154282 RepID=UPI00339E873B
MQQDGADVGDEDTGREQNGVPQTDGPTWAWACRYRQDHIRAGFRVGCPAQFHKRSYCG